MTIVAAAARLASLGVLANYPFAAWNNEARTALLGGTATLADGAAANAVTGTTYDFWLPNVTGTSAQFQITLAAAKSLTCAAIAAHNLGTLGASVAVQFFNGSAWVDAGAGVVAAVDNDPILFRMVGAGQTATQWRLNITNLTPGAPVYIGVVYFGVELVFPMRFYQGFAPVIRPTEVDLQSNVSVGNHLLGAMTVTTGSTMEASFQYLTPAFVRGVLVPFIDHFNAGRGFFFAWRPVTFVQDVHYAWREGATLRPENAGARDFMAFKMGMRLHNA